MSDTNSLPGIDPEMPVPRVSFALDTDIGTDVDDLLAIAMILGSPELDLTAVTTVYGDVELRARIVAKAFSAAGRPAPSIAPGRSETRSGRPVWWPGHEGSTIADLDTQVYSTDRDAIDELAASETIVAIAPLTNIADAVETSANSIRRIVMMGGEFASALVEHNIKCDIAAADALFRSNVEVVAVGLEQTQRIRYTATELDRVADAGPLGRLLDAETRRFWEFTNEEFNVPHDAIAALFLATPQLFEVSRGRVTVELGGAAAGRTRFDADPNGPHSIITDMDVDLVAREIASRVEQAATLAASTRI